MEPAKKAVTRIAKQALRTAGFELRRINRTIEKLNSERFFKPHPTCQVMGLGVLYELCFGRKRDGFFVEVGAYDGSSFSNSSCLAEVGWSGVLVEPVPEYAELCRQRYADNTRVRVVETAVGREVGVVRMEVATALSTANPQLATEYQTHAWSKNTMAASTQMEVRQTTLDTLLTAQGVKPGFEVLSVDVEGYESEVFAGFDLRHWTPTLMIVELCDLHPDLRATRASDAALSKHLVGSGYEIMYKDTINTVFIQETKYQQLLDA